MTFDDLIKTFKVQPDLNREFWTPENKLTPSIRKALLRIAKEFYDGIELENKPKIKDIVFTGSLANYNYSDYSDVDLHLLFDFGKDKELLAQFFLLAKSKWNDKEVFKGNVTRTIAAIDQSLERGDPKGAYFSKITVKN